MRDNTNPIYLTEFLSTAVFASPDDFSGNGNPGDGKAAAARWASRGIQAAIGAGSKYLKDNRLIQRVISEYPNPMDLKNELLKMDNANARTLAARLTPNMSPKDYKAYIRRYICQGTLGRYALHGLFGSYSAIGNALDAAGNEAMGTKDLIGKNL